VRGTQRRGIAVPTRAAQFRIITDRRERASFSNARRAGRAMTPRGRGTSYS
jgi:hypothetical protein